MVERAERSGTPVRRLRGASTISQQTAKNLFLWAGNGPTRWLRKGLEAWYTVLMEALWPKSRILEMYVNFAEFGDGIYGAQAAARSYWGKDASALSAAEAARLAAVLPSPRRYSATRPGPYVQRRANAIQRQMRAMGGTAALRALE
jgi:monofunctional biosynthetic peptidoglycan transglycosylase